MLRLLQRKATEVTGSGDGALRGIRRHRSSVPWRTVLVWFARAVALLWVMKGLSAWAIILGVWDSTESFSAMPFDFQTTVVYFAVIDLIAAVGLWMVSAWGGVMWLIAVMSQLVLSAFFPRLVTNSFWISLGLVLLMAVYLLLSWISSREETD